MNLAEILRRVIRPQNLSSVEPHNPPRYFNAYVDSNGKTFNSAWSSPTVEDSDWLFWQCRPTLRPAYRIKVIFK